MADATKSATFTTEFGHEFEAEREVWLTRRFLWYAGSVGTLHVLNSMISGLLLMTKAVPVEQKGATTVLGLQAIMAALSASLYWGAFVHVKRQRGNRDHLLRLVLLLIVANGFLQLLVALVSMQVGNVKLSIGQAWIGNILVSHLFACLFLPLTPRESFRPILPLLLVNAVFEVFSGDSWGTKAFVIGLSPLIGLPGAMICWWRHSRFRNRFALRFLRGRYGELRAELTNARQIHEALFPKLCSQGPVRFNYLYEPMRQIGGDYLYACFTPAVSGAAALNVVVIDVTGHGIPAALTVNRLHGELERIFAEDPGTGPGDVLSLLNRYVHLTLATHSVYVTAICFRVDPDADTIEYASGGHPPAFLRAVDGTVEQLDSTTFVLGACAAPDFKPEARSLKFTRGDALVAYTDGATEARDARGKFLGIAGMQKLLALGKPEGGWARTIVRAVDQHRQGPAQDDTLVIEITRPLDDGKHLQRSERTGRAAVSAP